MQSLKKILKRGLWSIFQAGQKVGLDILPRNFYSEIPDIHALLQESAWRKESSMQSVYGSELNAQLSILEQWLHGFVVTEIKTRNIHQEARQRNGTDGYGPIEAEALFAFVASEKPEEIFQIGCGVSTAICLMAAEFAGYGPRVTCVEPFPSDYLLKMEKERRIRLIRSKAQNLDLTEVENIGSHALFFVDSTHTLGPAGEVTKIILEMLPRLKKETVVHFHDILFPYDYPRDLLNGALFFPHESPLLHAFLSGNSRFMILCSLSMLHYKKKKELQLLMPHYVPAGDDEGLQVSGGHFPSATYLKVIQ